MNPQEEKEREKRQIILEGDPRVSEYEDFRDYLKASKKYDESVRFFVDKKFNLTESQKVLALADAFDEMDEENEKEYEEEYYKTKDKVHKVLDSAILKRELKIKNLQKEIDEFETLKRQIKYSGIDCLTIGLGHIEIDKIKKEVK